MKIIHEPGYCAICDSMRGRVGPKASPRPLVVWAIVVFVAGFVVGSLIAPMFLAPAIRYFAPSALSSVNAEPDSGMRSGLSDQGNVSIGGSAVRAGPAPRHTSSTPAEDPPASDPLPTFTTPVGREDPAVLLAITNAAQEFGVDAATLVRVARCESSLRPGAVGDNGAALGLFQFHEYRWWINAAHVGYTNDLRHDPIASSRVAAYAFAHGQAGAWTCK